MCLNFQRSAALDAHIKLAASPLILPNDPDPFSVWAIEQDKFLRALADRMESGLDKSVWLHEFDRWVREGHIEAHRRGQLTAEGTVQEALARLRGRTIADNESPFIQGFYNDISDGNFTDDYGDFKADALYYRMRLYLGKMRGTAGYGFVDGSSSTEVFDWVVGGVEDHCADCPILASGGPYTHDTLYTTPGMCDTPCLGNCKCHLRRHSDGLTSPQPLVS